MLPLCGMSPKGTPRHKNFDRHVSFDKDMNSIPLPGQVELRDDVEYLHIAYDKTRDVIHRQEGSLQFIGQSLHVYMDRTDSLLKRIESLERKINKRPWYKRMNCFRRR
jgi:hypothetical protein